MQVKGYFLHALVVEVSDCTSVRSVQCAEEPALASPSEPHAYPPRVVCENFVFFLHDTGVCAFVDGVGHDGDVVVFQGDVVGMRVL